MNGHHLIIHLLLYRSVTVTIAPTTHAPIVSITVPAATAHPVAPSSSKSAKRSKTTSSSKSSKGAIVGNGVFVWKKSSCYILHMREKESERERERVCVYSICEVFHPTKPCGIFILHVRIDQTKESGQIKLMKSLELASSSSAKQFTS